MFGNLFDFNRDGKTDAFEFAMGMGLLEELEKDDNDDNEDNDDNDDNEDDS